MRQLSLLGPEPASPSHAPTLAVPPVPGLAYVADYVTADEERELLAAIDREPWQTDWQRRRQVYGLSYGSARSEGRTLGPLPRWLAPYADRIRRDGHLEDDVVNVVVNEYEPGQGIGMHHDYPGFGPTVVAVSLGSACLLDLARVVGEGEARRVEASAVLDVQPRSLWVLGGEARSRWQHGIAHRKSDVVAGVKRPRGRRVSVTMRTARRTGG